MSRLIAISEVCGISKFHCIRETKIIDGIPQYKDEALEYDLVRRKRSKVMEKYKFEYEYQSILETIQATLVNQKTKTTDRNT